MLLCNRTMGALIIAEAPVSVHGYDSTRSITISLHLELVEWTTFSAANYIDKSLYGIVALAAICS